MRFPSPEITMEPVYRNVITKSEFEELKKSPDHA